MAVDEIIYGASSTWINCPNDAKAIAKMMPNNAIEYVKNGEWELNTKIDNSIVFCGAVGNWYLANVLIFWKNVPTDSENVPIGTSTEIPLYAESSKIDWFFNFIRVYSDYTNYGTYPYTLNIFGTSSEKKSRWSFYNQLSDITSGNQFLDDYKQRPIFNLDIKKILLVPYVYCTNRTNFDNGTPSTQYVTLSSYVANNNSIRTNNPYITSVNFHIYYNSGTDDSPSWSDIGYHYNFAVQIQNDFSDTVLSIPMRSTVRKTYAIGPTTGSSNYCLLMGLAGNGIVDVSDNNHPIGYDPEPTHYVYNSDRTKIMYCREWSDDLYNEIRKQIAFYGMFFLGENGIDTPATGWTNTSLSGATFKINSPSVGLGTIENGYTYGNYTLGADNENGVQMSWDTTGDSDYDPNAKPPEPIPESDPTTFNPVELANGGLKRYVVDATNLNQFGREMWDIIDISNPDELIQNQTLTNFLTNNPLDCIVSIKRFPLSDMRQTVSATNPMLGKVKVLNVLAYPFDANSTILSCGTKKIPRFFNDFRDYLCRYELILPFCGTLNLDPESVVGKNIEIKYAIDYTTGTCTAWVLCDTTDGKQVVIDSANGNCCIDIPMSGVETATLTGEIYNANENLKTAKFNAITSGVLNVGNFVSDIKNRNIGGAVGVAAKTVNAVHDIKKQEWNIEHTEIPLKMVGASSGCNSFQIELTPRLTAYVPKTLSTYNESNYLHTVGAAVCDTTTIGSYSGYAEITNVDLSGFAATNTEKQMIANALGNGVYL